MELMKEIETREDSLRFLDCNAPTSRHEVGQTAAGIKVARNARVARVATRLAQIVLLFVVAVWGASFKYYFGVGNNKSYVVIVDSGEILICVSLDASLGTLGIPLGVDDPSIRPLLTSPRMRFQRNPTRVIMIELVIPFWLAFLIASALTAITWVWRKQATLRNYRLTNGLCLSCGYDLRGSMGRSCSECGSMRTLIASPPGDRADATREHI